MSRDALLRDMKSKVLSSFFERFEISVKKMVTRESDLVSVAMCEVTIPMDDLQDIKAMHAEGELAKAVIDKFSEALAEHHKQNAKDNSD